MLNIIVRRVEHNTKIYPEFPYFLELPFSSLLLSSIACFVVTFLLDVYCKSFCVAHVSHIIFNAVEVELHSPFFFFIKYINIIIIIIIIIIYINIYYSFFNLK